MSKKYRIVEETDYYGKISYLVERYYGWPMGWMPAGSSPSLELAEKYIEYSNYKPKRVIVK